MGKNSSCLLATNKPRYGMPHSPHCRASRVGDYSQGKGAYRPQDESQSPIVITATSTVVRCSNRSDEVKPVVLDTGALSTRSGYEPAALIIIKLKAIPVI